MPINAKLVVVGGEVKTAEIRLRLPSTIGRGRGCTIMLPQALVSRQHCEIFESGGKLMVRDLGSLNGTFVNNQKLAEPSPINSEELLSIGTVTFRVMYDTAGASSPPPGPAPTMKPSAKETLPAAVAPTPSSADDNSEPLEIGEFNFEETAQPNSEPLASEMAIGDKTPSGPLQMPSFNAAETKKPDAMPPVPVMAVAKPTAPPAAVAPVAKLIVPAAVPTPKSVAAPPASAPEAEEGAEEEDDFQDFLKSLGK